MWQNVVRCVQINIVDIVLGQLNKIRKGAENVTKATSMQQIT